MREQIIQELAGLLHDNLGQRLTPALATGIATLMNQAIALVEGTNDSCTQEGPQLGIGIISKGDGATV